jgi:hypothetical protein
MFELDDGGSNHAQEAHACERIHLDPAIETKALADVALDSVMICRADIEVYRSAFAGLAQTQGLKDWIVDCFTFMRVAIVRPCRPAILPPPF